MTKVGLDVSARCDNDIAEYERLVKRVIGNGY